MKTRIVLIVLAVLYTGTIVAKGVPIKARYPGGDHAMKSYLHDSLHYPEADKQAGTEGIVYMEFTVTKAGKTFDPHTKASINSTSSMESEAKRLVLAMPVWEPAEGDKGPVSEIRTVEVRFELPDSLVKLPPASSDTSVMNFAENMPLFMGGESNFSTYLQMSIIYPQLEKEMGKQGTVYITYIVEANGTTTHVKCVKGVPGAPGFAKAGISVMENCPRWQPGETGGQAVRVQETVPIKFVLN